MLLLWMSVHDLRKRMGGVRSDRRSRESGLCGGHASQRSRVHSRGSACAAGSLEIAVRLRLNGRRCWVLHPVPGRSRDERCPSGSGRGKAPLFASERMVWGAGRREPAGLWPEQPRLAPGGSVAIEPQGSQRRRCYGVTRMWRSMWRKGPQPLSEFTPSPAQAGRAASDGRAGDRMVPRLCLRTVLVAGFDERRLV